MPFSRKNGAANLFRVFILILLPNANTYHLSKKVVTAARPTIVVEVQLRCWPFW